MNSSLKFKAVIFDLDGTLVDSAPGLARAMNEVLEKNNFPTLSIDKYHEFIGNGIKALVEQSAPSGTPQELCEELYRQKTALYESYWQAGTTIYPGVLEVLNELKRQGVLMGVVSSKEEYFTKKMVEYFFAEIPFVGVVGRSKEILKKPDPMGVQLIIAKTLLTPESWVLVGDKTVDLDTAKNAKIGGIWVSWGYQGETPPTEFIAKIDSPNELLAYF